MSQTHTFITGSLLVLFGSKTLQSAIRIRSLRLVAVRGRCTVWLGRIQNPAVLTHVKGRARSPAFVRLAKNPIREASDQSRSSGASPESLAITQVSIFLPNSFVVYLRSRSGLT